MKPCLSYGDDLKIICLKRRRDKTLSYWWLLYYIPSSVTIKFIFLPIKHFKTFAIRSL